MDWEGFATALGRAKQTQVRMVLARGFDVSASERELLGLSAREVSARFVAAALQNGRSVPESMGAVYVRKDASGEARLYVRFLGAHVDAGGTRKPMSVDAVRTAIDAVKKVEGDVFAEAAVRAQNGRRFGALRDAVATHARACSRRPPAHAGGSKLTSSAPLDTSPSSTASSRSVSALIVAPTTLTPDAAKEVARSREWVSVMTHEQLAIPLEEHKSVPEHIFLRGDAATAALEALHADFATTPALQREDRVVQYFGGHVGDIARVQLPQGVVHWVAVR